jgi:hypothetical protein
MIRTQMQVEGSWEQIASLAPSLAGYRLRLTVLDRTAEQALESQAEPKPTLSGRFATIRDENPEAWHNLPTDLSAQHDHYIYGWPKK